MIADAIKDREMKSVEPRAPRVSNPYNPASGLVPLADVSFGAPEIVLPHELPPQSMPYPQSWFSYLSGFPGVQTIYENRRNGVVKF